MEPLISIVVIGRNEQARIARCLESCLAADWDHKEIICCDSESTDQTVEIARRYPVRVIVHKNHQRNPSVGRNVGWHAAQGDLVYFIDADMTLHPDFLQRAFPVLTSSEKIACVIGRRQEMHTDNFYVRLVDASYHAYGNPGEVDSPGGGGGLFKRAALVDTCGYYERFRCSEEQILGQELRRQGYKIILIDAVMATHDVGVHTLRQYLRFEARVAKLLADTLLLDDHILESAHRVALKHFVEFVLLVGWCLGFVLLGHYRVFYAGLSATALAALLLSKYLAVRTRPMGNVYFVRAFLLAKPLHIVFQMYYLLLGFLRPFHFDQIPDGEIVADWPAKVSPTSWS